jgi:hypothetical protein
MGSGFTTFTAGNVLTASEVNNYLMEQSVMVFATTGARDSAITAPEAGMTAYINSGDSSEGLYSYTGTTWNKGPGWNAPWGLLSKAVLTTSNVTSATHTTQQDGSAPITLTATTITNRIYRVTSTHMPAFATAGEYIGFVPVIGGVSQTQFQYNANSSTILNSITNTFTYTETAGASRIFKIQIKSNLLNTQVTDYGLAPFSRTLVVEDIGPSGAPN